jgi:hypothetical protein
MECRQMQSVISATEAKGTDVRLGISCQTKSIFRSPSLVLRRWWWSSRARIVSLELCSLVDRIRWLFEIREAELLRGSDRVHTWLRGAQLRPPESRQRDCMAYIEKTRQLHPFLSTFDTLLLVKAWQSGAEWTAGIEDKSQSQERSS